MKKINLACIIEDEPMHLYITKKLLDLTGMVESLLIFNNGKEAYDKLTAIFKASEKLPELILLDLNMPIWDGWQFLDEFTKLKLKTEVFIYILTSSNDIEDKNTAAKYNLQNNFLTKPITANEVKVLLNTVTA